MQIQSKRILTKSEIRQNLKKVMDTESIRESLENTGLRFTPQRHCVMAFLMEYPGHPTAAEIFEAVNRLDPRLSKVTLHASLHAHSIISTYK